VKDKLTDEQFWDNYWKSLQLPSTVNPAFTFDRCLGAALKKRVEATGVRGKVLEVGAAPGKWLAFFHELGGFQPSALDYSQEGVEAMKKNFRLLQIEPENLLVGDFFQIQPEPVYDVVMSLGFIEHFEDPVMVIERHLQWLKPGGVLVLGVPNFASVHGVLQYFLKKSILKVHNLKIMNVRFFRSLEKQLPVRAQSIEYLGSLEPSLPITDPGGGVRTFLPKLFLKAFYHFRRLKFTDQVNGPWISSYILSVYRKEEHA
jgi:2-polyprenyl-3-methyl-5-hydroxy-6-metoxy-1,4-benzoquinol methylase